MTCMTQRGKNIRSKITRVSWGAGSCLVKSVCLHVVINLYPSQPITWGTERRHTHSCTQSGHAVSPAATSEPFTLTHIERERGCREIGVRWKERRRLKGERWRNKDRRERVFVRLYWESLKCPQLSALMLMTMLRHAVRFKMNSVCTDRLVPVTLCHLASVFNWQL